MRGPLVISLVVVTFLAIELCFLTYGVLKILGL